MALATSRAGSPTGSAISPSSRTRPTTSRSSRRFAACARSWPSSIDRHSSPRRRAAARGECSEARMHVRGGVNLYGFSVGILVLDTQFPRIPGDIGNATTFDFPVRYHRVVGATSDAVVRQGARTLLPLFVEGARFLEREGVRAISTSCGFLAKFQREMAAAVSIPVFTSSLMLVPLLHRMLRSEEHTSELQSLRHLV